MTAAVLPPVRLEPEPEPERRWNPHYLAYAAAHGFPGDPDGMLAHDRDAHLGGSMVPFLIWIPAQRTAFLAERGLPADHRLTDAELAAFTAWLTERTARAGA